MAEILLEAPVFNIEAALEAARIGIDRLELCADFGEGGITPSGGTLKLLKEKITIPVFIMIRPRGGDFVYTENELQVMKEDIQLFRKLGADGFVFGVLTEEGHVDKPACKALIAAAQGLPCSFHRAFDASRSLERSLEDIIDCEFQRILTSGGKNSVEEGLEVIIDLMKLAKSRIIIMPGGGLKPDHVSLLSERGTLAEIHASCKGYKPSIATYSNPDLQLVQNGLPSDKILTIDEKIAYQFFKTIKNVNKQT